MGDVINLLIFLTALFQLMHRNIEFPMAKFTITIDLIRWWDYAHM